MEKGELVGTISIIASLAITVALIAYIGPRRVLETLSELRPEFLAAAIAITIISLAIKTLKWIVLAKGSVRHGKEYMASYISVFLPTPMLDATRIGIFRKFGRGVGETVPLILWERFTDLAAMAMLLASGLSFFINPYSSLAITLSLFLFFAFFIYLAFYNKRFQKFVVSRAEALGKGDDVRKMLENGRMETWQITSSILLSLAFWITNIAVLQVIFLNYSVPIEFNKTVALFAFSMVVSTLIPLPAGVGSMEGVFMAFGGMEKHYAIVSIMVFRLVTFGIQFLISFLLLITLRKSGKASPASRQ